MVDHDQTTANYSQMPRELTFTEDSLMIVIVNSILFVIAAVGNLTVFITLFRNRHRKSRVNRFIMHLSAADLIVTFVTMPLETIWAITVSWKAGDFACRVFMLFRAFGLYLSTFILVTISLDRYFAILHPLSMNDADRRAKLMLSLAWIFSLVASLPQSIIFHLEYHPVYRWYTQCVTFNFFPTPGHELAYNIFNLITIYGLPLTVIVIFYSLILIEITKKSKEGFVPGVKTSSKSVSIRLRRSGGGRIERARIKTLKMTLMMVFVFIMCWTPYFVMSTWWWFAKESAENVDQRIQKGLFLFAVSNTCMNPLVYGIFSLDFKQEFRRCCWCLAARAREEEIASRLFRNHSQHQIHLEAVVAHSSTATSPTPSSAKQNRPKVSPRHLSSTVLTGYKNQQQRSMNTAIEQPMVSNC